MIAPASPLTPAPVELTVTSTGKTCPRGGDPPTAGADTAGNIDVFGVDLTLDGLAEE